MKGSKGREHRGNHAECQTEGKMHKASRGCGAAQHSAAAQACGPESFALSPATIVIHTKSKTDQTGTDSHNMQEQNART